MAVSPQATKTIQDGSYTPLARPLFIYPNKVDLKKPEVNAFVKYYLDNYANLADIAQLVAMTPSRRRSRGRLSKAGRLRANGLGSRHRIGTGRAGGSIPRRRPAVAWRGRFACPLRRGGDLGPDNAGDPRRAAASRHRLLRRRRHLALHLRRTSGRPSSPRLNTESGSSINGPSWSPALAILVAIPLGLRLRDIPRRYASPRAREVDQTGAGDPGRRADDRLRLLCARRSSRRRSSRVCSVVDVQIFNVRRRPRW